MSARARLAALMDEPLLRATLRNRPLRPYRRWRFASFGPNSMIDRPAWVYGSRRISIGRGTVILRGAWLAAEPSAPPGPALRIGNNVWVRPYCTLSASESVTIEDDVVIAAYSTVIDSDHTIVEGSANVLWNPSVTAPVRIGRGTWIGDRVSVQRGSDIGERCIIGSNSVVRGIIPDHSIAVGSPARVVGSTAGKQLEKREALFGAGGPAGHDFDVHPVAGQDGEAGILDPGE